MYTSIIYCETCLALKYRKAVLLLAYNMIHVYATHTKIY